MDINGNHTTKTKECGIANGNNTSQMPNLSLNANLEDFISYPTSFSSNKPDSMLRIHSYRVDYDYDTTGCVPLLSHSER